MGSGLAVDCLDNACLAVSRETRIDPGGLERFSRVGLKLFFKSGIEKISQRKDSRQEKDLAKSLASRMR